MAANPLEQLEQLKQQLEAGLTSPGEIITAIDQLTQNHRSWRTKYWQQERQKLLAEHCQQCGSTASPLVLQHMWHPPSVSEAQTLIYDEYQKNHPLESEPSQFVDESTLPTRGSCPKCGSLNIVYRKRAGHWYCQGITDKRKCGFTFDKPIEVPDPNAKKERIALIARELGKKRFQQFLDEDAYQRRVAVILIEGSFRYLSFTDTTTFCKKCAYQWDIQRKKICPQCKKNYIEFKYDMCFSCLYDKATGIFRLTISNAKRWLRRAIPADCGAITYDKLSGPEFLELIACVLRSYHVEVLGTENEHLLVRATQGQVWEALSGQPSFFPDQL